MGASLPVRTVVCLAALLMAASVRAENTATPPPLNPGLTERAESRLFQFELRVSRRGIPVGGLTSADLDIELGGKPLKAFTVDDMCIAGTEAPAPATRPGAFIFYFDDPELTVEGRLRSVEVARLVAPALIAHGHDLLILRNGPSLRAETAWTHDPAELSLALDRIASDPGNRDSLRTAMNEMQAERLIDRAKELVHESNLQFSDAMFDAYSQFANGGQSAAMSAAGGGMQAPGKTYSAHGASTPGSKAAFGDAVGFDGKGNSLIADLAAEFRTLVQDQLVKNERDIERLRSAVRSLSLRPSPKGVVYFSDTLRRDPGGVITRLLGSATEFTSRRNELRAGTAMPAWTSDEELTALVRDASTYGVRFYAVEGRGLGAPSDWVRTSQDTIVSMALETGGLAFVNGLAARSIADSIAADQSCWYLVSFVPSGWETDRSLDLDVRSKKPGLRVVTLSSLVIPSQATLTQSRLLAAHMGDPGLKDNPLSVSIYPVGGTAKRLQVLAQVRLPEGGIPQARDTTWDIGFDVVSGGVVIAHNAGRVAWRGSGQPPVYQSTLWLPAGPYEIVAVAREDATDSIRSGRVNGTWPASSVERVTLSRPALAQPQSGGIVLDGDVKDSGIVVRGEGNPVDPRRPAAVVTALCVEGSPDRIVRAERSIVGETEVKFDPMDIGSDEGRCVQIRDLVAAGTLGAGRLTYLVRILSGDAEIAAQEFSFDVAEVPAAGK